VGSIMRSAATDGRVPNSRSLHSAPSWRSDEGANGVGPDSRGLTSQPPQSKAHDFVERCQVAICEAAPMSGVARGLFPSLATVWKCARTTPPVDADERHTVVSALLRLFVFVVYLLSYGAAASAASDRDGEQLWDVFRFRCFDQGCNLSALAASLGVSYFQLSRSLYGTTGEHFGTHLTGVRIGRAAVLLATSELSVKEISGAVGYAHTGCLDRQFQRWLRLTPIAFRQAIRLKALHPRAVDPDLLLQRIPQSSIWELSDIYGIDSSVLLSRSALHSAHRQSDLGRVCLSLWVPAIGHQAVRKSG